jgi:hypothetical protein
MRTVSNTEASFWAHVLIQGPDECWPWLMGTDYAGHGRFRYEGRVRYTHLIVYLFEHNEWLKQSDVVPCPLLKSCCNPEHIKKSGKPVQHLSKRRTENAMRERSRVYLFTELLNRNYSELSKLAELLGDQLKEFLDEYDGETLKLPKRAELNEAHASGGLADFLTNDYPELTKLVILLGANAKLFLDQYEGQILQVPSRPELREIARAVACHTALKDLEPARAAKVGKKLQANYHCEEGAITRLAKLGQRLVEDTKNA